VEGRPAESGRGPAFKVEGKKKKVEGMEQLEEFIPLPMPKWMGGRISSITWERRECEVEIRPDRSGRIE